MTTLLSQVWRSLEAAIDYAERSAQRRLRVIEVWRMPDGSIGAGASAPEGAIVLHVAQPPQTLGQCRY